MAKTIQKVNVKKAVEKRMEFLAVAEKNIDTIEKCHISIGNSKMGKIPSFSVSPIITCKNCANCSGYCYASKGCFNFNNNIMNVSENTALIKNNIGRVYKEINTFLNNSTTLYRYFRWNVSGDVFSLDYLLLIDKIAIENPMTKFLVFTKNYELFNTYYTANAVPANLSIIFSQWSNVEISNPLGFPVAQVNVQNETIVNENSFHCNGDCANCIECWNAKKGTNRHFDLH